MIQSSQTPGATAAPASNPLFTLLELSRLVRQAGTPAELRFLLVNDSHALAAYRQAGFWLADAGLQALSGVVHPDANAPYAQWLSRICAELAKSQPKPAPVTAADLPLSDAGIAHLAVTRQSLVTCRQVWSTVPAQHSPWLAALPWPVASGAARYLLLIHRMDFNAVNWRTFSRIQMI